MTEIILHHYPASPYGEIVRTALGMKGLAWRSVHQPNIMPRPFLAPLIGGYRRIPVMQIGADFFCDTAAILREIDRRKPTPPLTPPGQEGIAWALRSWAERAVFQASVAVIFAERGAAVEESFIKDREQLSGRPFDMAAMQAAAPMLADQWRAHLSFVDERLGASGAWLLGDQPGLADLAAYLNIWFMRVAEPAIFDRFRAGAPNIRPWADRMAAIGHGTPSPMPAEDAMAVARAADPDPARPSDPHEPQGLKPGMTVAVMADDYGRDPTIGEIVFCDAREIAVRRDTPESGAVVVHFPRAGFLVRPV